MVACYNPNSWGQNFLSKKNMYIYKIRTIWGTTEMAIEFKWSTIRKGEHFTMILIILKRI